MEYVENKVVLEGTFLKVLQARSKHDLCTLKARLKVHESVWRVRELRN